MMRIKVREWQCSMCEETSRKYYCVHDDGTVETEYEGCGGYQGRNAETGGKAVSASHAIEVILERRGEAIGEIECFR